VLCILAFCFCFVFTTPFNIAYKADAGFKRAKRNIDPRQLQTWAIQEISKHPFTNDNQILRDIPQSEIPSQMQNLYSYPPEAAVLRNDSDEIPYVKIIWGGGFFHWFFAVGPTNFSVSTNNTFYKTTEWTQGVYYSREGH